MKLKFRYDYRHKVLVITHFVSVAFLAITIWSYPYNILGFLMLLLCTVINFLNSILFIRRQGIEYDPVTGKVTIRDYYPVNKLNINYIAFAECKELEKTKGNPFKGFFLEYYHPSTYMLDCDHVYHNGKVYRIIFHLRDETSIESYFGWMYKERSEKVVQKVEYELNVFLKQLNEAIPRKKPFRKP